MDGFSVVARREDESGLREVVRRIDSWDMSGVREKLAHRVRLSASQWRTLPSEERKYGFLVQYAHGAGCQDRSRIRGCRLTGGEVLIGIAE